MKKFACMLTAAFMLLAAGCSQVADDSVVLPPVRIGEGVSSPLFAKRYTFETAFLEADAVVRIKIGNWLSEDIDNMFTRYEATVLQCFKGDVSDAFTLIQEGCSDCTMKGYPLFTYGNELLVFLTKATMPPDYEMPWSDESYWITGCFTTVLDVTYDAEGNRYYADNHDFLGETMGISSNYVNQKDILSEVYSSAVNSDPFVANIADEQNFYSYIFSEADVNNLINKYKIS